MIEKELLLISECPNNFRVIIFGYEINIYADYNNMFYITIKSESKIVTDGNSL